MPDDSACERIAGRWRARSRGGASRLRPDRGTPRDRARSLRSTASCRRVRTTADRTPPRGCPWTSATSSGRSTSRSRAVARCVRPRIARPCRTGTRVRRRRARRCRSTSPRRRTRERRCARGRLRPASTRRDRPRRRARSRRAGACARGRGASVMRRGRTGGTARRRRRARSPTPTNRADRTRSLLQRLAVLAAVGDDRRAAGIEGGGRIAHDELRRHPHRPHRLGRVVEMVQEQLDRDAALLPRRLPECREREHVGELVIVDADHAEVARHLHAESSGGDDRADRHFVARRDDRGRPGAHVAEGVDGCGVASGHRHVGDDVARRGSSVPRLPWRRDSRSGDGDRPAPSAS